MTGGVLVARMRALAALGVAGVALLPGLARADNLPGQAQSGWSCGSMINVTVATSKASDPAAITGTQDVQCAVPVVSGGSTSSGGGPGAPLPVDGTHCKLTHWQPVTLSPVGAYSDGQLFQFDGTWPEPPGSTVQGNQAEDSINVPTTPTPYQAPSDPEHFPVVNAALYQGFNDVQVRYDMDATYQGGVCTAPQGAKWQECVIQGVIYRGSTLSGSHCARIVSHAPVPTQPPGWGLDQGGLANLLAEVKGLVKPGTVGSWPNGSGPSDGALVNLDTYFWIDGANAAPRYYQTRIATPPDGNGRSVVYQYVITVQLAQVTWDFGDGTTSPPMDGAQGLGQPRPTKSSVHHPYSTISVRGCKACAGPGNADYKVTATEHYTVDVTAVYWTGAGAPVSQHLDALSQGLAFDVPAGEHDVYTGQLEGVPVG